MTLNEQQTKVVETNCCLEVKGRQYILNLRASLLPVSFKTNEEIGLYLQLTEQASGNVWTGKQHPYVLKYKLN